jgi:hypothetical protein
MRACNPKREWLMDAWLKINLRRCCVTTCWSEIAADLPPGKLHARNGTLTRADGAASATRHQICRRDYRRSVRLFVAAKHIDQALLQKREVELPRNLLGRARLQLVGRSSPAFERSSSPVDRVERGKIRLARSDSGEGHHKGHYHFIDLGFVADVEGQRVRLSANSAIAVTLEEE